MKIDGGEAKLVFILLLFLIANFAVIINQSTDISAALPDRNNNTNITSTQTTTTKKDNDYKTNETGIISNAASPGNSTDDSECVNYDNHTRTINVCSGKLSLTKLSSILNNPGVLNRTSTKNWFLNANILVRGADSILFINSTDTDWLKINSTGGTAYSISVRGKGSLVIDHTKITSWNSTSNTVTNLKSHTEPKRAFLMISISGSHMNITNSNLSYLGYLTYTKSGGDNGTTTGIAYYGGNGSVIKNNLISFNHRGFYSRAVSNIAIENNTVYNNFEYGLDPHTGTEDMKISNNRIFDNGAHGVICSQFCKDIIVEKNLVYNNKGHGIDLDQLIANSTVKNNTIYNNTYSGIANWNSYNNIAHNNVIYNNTFGIILTQNSHDNIIKDNLIKNSSRYGMYVYANSTKNKFEGNTILNSSANGIYVQDNTTKYNSFIKNKVADGRHIGIQFFNSSHNTLIDNRIYNNADYNYYAKSNSTNNVIADTIFNNTVLRFFDNSSNFILKNSDNRIISNNKKIANIAYPINTTLLASPIYKSIILDSSDMIVTPSSNHVNITSWSDDHNSDQKYKKWTQVSSHDDSRLTTGYVLGGFLPKTQIMIKVNGSFWNAYTSNSSGYINFAYDGGGLVRFEAEANNKPVMITIAVLASLTIGLTALFIIKKRRARKVLLS